MITRVVKMTFKKESAEEFIQLFRENKEIIRNFEGCHTVSLFRENGDSNTFFTISLWKDTGALESYRSSDFFRKTWTRTKALFSERAEAWSLNQILQSKDDSV